MTRQNFPSPTEALLIAHEMRECILLIEEQRRPVRQCDIQYLADQSENLCCELDRIFRKL